MSQTKTSPQPPEPAGTQTGFTLRYLLILLALMWTVQLNPIVGLLGGNAQSEIAIHYQTTQIAWFSLSSLLVGTFLTPFVFKAAAIYGKKRLLVIVTLIGCAGDLVAAFSTNYEILLVGRSIAGVYGAAAAVAYAMARDVFPRNLVGPASGILAGSVGLVALGGPFLSGWVLDNHGFRGVLWFMVIATAIGFVLVALLPESPVREARVGMDWIGGALLGASFSSIIYAIGQGEHWGWTDGRTLGFLALGVLALVLFPLWERRIEHPLLSMDFIGQRRVWSVLLATAVAAASIFAVGTATQLLMLMPNIPGLSEGLGWSATHAAIITSPASVLILVTAVIAGTAARRVDARKLLAGGGILVALGYFLTSQFHASAGQIIVPFIIGGIGTGLVVSTIPIMVIEAVSPQEQAAANGTQQMVQGVAQALISQLAFVVMARSGTVAKGIQFYNDEGFRNGILVVTAFSVLGVLLILLIPRVKALKDTEAGQAAPTA